MQSSINQTRPVKLSDQLANVLRDAINTGQFLPGQPIPSERELCEAHSLSRTTVRRAIDLLVEEGILHRVPGSGTFVSEIDHVQVGEAMVGLIVPTLANPFFAELSNTIEQHAIERGYQILVGQSDYSNNYESSYMMRYADNRSVKGIIIVPNVDTLSLGAYQYLVDKGTPFIFVARYTDQIVADAVSTDHFVGAKRITEYLIEMGHQHIAYIEGLPHQPNSRLLGYRAALSNAKIPICDDLTVLLDQPAELAGLNGGRQLMQSGREFTAIFARNDITASGVLRGLNEAGLRVPDDVSLVGFDSTKLSTHLQPPLTTVDHTMSEIGRQAVNFLLDRIEGIYDGPARRVIVQPRLVFRDSCKPPTGNWSA